MGWPDSGSSAAAPATAPRLAITNAKKQAMTLAKAIVSIQKRAAVENSDRGARTTCSGPPAPSFVRILVVSILIMSILGGWLDAGNVETLAVRIQGAGDFDVFAFVLLRSVL